MTAACEESGAEHFRYEASEEKRERDDDENRTRQIIEIDSQRIPCKDRQSVENDEKKDDGRRTADDVLVSFRQR